ncbi:unnamed protein product [Ixodes pacificus]
MLRFCVFGMWEERMHSSQHLPQNLLRSPLRIDLALHKCQARRPSKCHSDLKYLVLSPLSPLVRLKSSWYPVVTSIVVGAWR